MMFSSRTKGPEVRDRDIHPGFLFFRLRRFHRFVPGKPVVVLIPNIANLVSNHPPCASVPPAPIDVREIESECVVVHTLLLNEIVNC